jgi:hypothetical protein
MSRENRARLNIGVLILGLGWTPAQTPEEGPPVRLAQQTVVVLPQIQAFTACVMNCDTTSGACQGACSVNNSPALTSATGAHEALTQCYLSCKSQQLACKQGYEALVRVLKSGRHHPTSQAKGQGGC